MKTSDERKLEANFNDELTALIDKYLALGIDPDVIADAFRAERLRAALTAARDALHNDFEPDNQSRAYKAADAALRETE